MLRVALVYFIAACATISTAQSQEIPVTVIDFTKSAIVPILCVRRDADDRVVAVNRLGTGFFVNRNGYFVTPEHVLRAANALNEERPCSLAVATPKQPWRTRLIKIEEKAFYFLLADCVNDATRDLAVCKPHENPFRDKEVIAPRTLSFSSVQENEDGTAVAFTGFPLSFGSPLTSVAHLGGYFPADETLVIDTSNWPGASGSPIYNRKGLVIGMITRRGAEDASGLTYAKPSDAILAFLREKQITVEK